MKDTEIEESDSGLDIKASKTPRRSFQRQLKKVIEAKLGDIKLN